MLTVALPPNTALSGASGCTGFMKAAFGFRPAVFFFLATGDLLKLGTLKGVAGAYHETSDFFSNSHRGNSRYPRGRPSKIALSRSDGTSFPTDFHLERVHFPVQLFRRKSEGVLAMQFVGDPRERRPEVV